jgi:hypothetical protein
MITQTHETTAGSGGPLSSVESANLPPGAGPDHARLSREAAPPVNAPPAEKSNPAIAAPRTSQAQLAAADGMKNSIDRFLRLWGDTSVSMLEVQMALSALLLNLKKAMLALKRAEVHQVGDALRKAADEMLEAAKLHRDSAIAQAVGEIAGGALELAGTCIACYQAYSAHSKVEASQQRLDLLEDQNKSRSEKAGPGGLKVVKTAAPNDSNSNPGGDGIKAVKSDKGKKRPESEKDGESHIPAGGKISVSGRDNEAAPRTIEDSANYPAVPEEERKRIRNLGSDKLPAEIEKAKKQRDADRDHANMMSNGGTQIFNQMASSSGRILSGSARFYAAQIDYQAAEWERRSKYSEASSDVNRGEREQFTDDEHEANSLAEQTKNRANDIIQNAYQTQLRIVTA